LGGYSGSSVQRIDGIVRKQSTYLRRCPDYAERREFLNALSAAFPSIPNLRLFDEGLMEMDFIEGREGIEEIDFQQYGGLVRELHTIEIPAPAKDTGLDWLVDLAVANLGQSEWQAGIELVRPFRGLPADAIVHGEITQVITDATGRLYLIDWDECGWGSKYQDLGFVYYQLKLANRVDECFAAFIDGYGQAGLELSLIPKVAGLIALAYAGFYDFERRIRIGQTLLSSSRYDSPSG
jgi:hypothetical protein